MQGMVQAEITRLAALDDQHRQVRFSDFCPDIPPRTEPWEAGFRPRSLELNYPRPHA